jgi:hypothetical protein
MKKRLLLMLCACVVLDWYTKKNLFPTESKVPPIITRNVTSSEVMSKKS